MFFGTVSDQIAYVRVFLLFSLKLIVKTHMESSRIILFIHVLLQFDFL